MFQAGQSKLSIAATFSPALGHLLGPSNLQVPHERISVEAANRLLSMTIPRTDMPVLAKSNALAAVALAKESPLATSVTNMTFF